MLHSFKKQLRPTNRSYADVKRFKSSYNMKSFRDNWLSDPGAYPLVVLIAVAILLPVSFGIRYLATSPDVHIFKEGRKSIFRGMLTNEEETDHRGKKDKEDTK